MYAPARYVAGFGELDPTGTGVLNPVTGLVVPLADILYAGPSPVDPSQSMLSIQPTAADLAKGWTSGGTWSWSGIWSGAVIGAPVELAVSSLTAAAANVTAAAEQQRQAELTLVHSTYDYVLRPSLRKDNTWTTIAQRTYKHLSDGSVEVTPWRVYNPGTSYPLSEWQSGVVAGQPIDTEHLILRDTLSAAEWAAIEAESLASGLAPQTFVPYIPGSQVFVPLPGTTEEPTIILPGTTTPIPVSALPPELQTANVVATETAAQIPAPLSPTAALPNSTAASAALAPGAAPSYYAIPGGAYRSPATPEEPAPVVAAGFGGVALIGVGILGLVLLLGTRQRGRRVPGYRRF